MSELNIAIILARGGSKRLPRKNIKDLCGKPMINWTIEAAINSNCFSRILVSTDDEEIQSIAIKAGAEVPFLRGSGADDHTPSSEATLIALRQAEEYWSESYSTVTQLMANCPLRNSIDIKNSLDNFIKEDAKSQLSSFKFGWMNPWWSFELVKDGYPKYKFPKALKSRSQDLPTLYCPSGAIWITYTKYLKEYKTFYHNDHISFPLSWISSVDIDDNDDFQMAEYFMFWRKRK